MLKPAAMFLLRFLLVFLLLLAPLSVTKRAYASLLRFGGTCLFASFPPNGTVHFFPTSTLTPEDVPKGYKLPAPDRGLDIHLKLTSRSSRTHMTILHTNSRYIAYVPTAFVAALILATPIPWPRKWRALLWGMLLVSAFVALKFAVWLVFAFARNDPVAMFHFGPFGRGVMRHLYSVIVTGVPGTYIFPLPIWILVTFRRADWPRLTQPPTTKPPTAPKDVRRA